jgi:hypothetical protein
MTTTKQQNPYRTRFATIDKHEMSEWKCYLFGGRSDSNYISWRPRKGKEPNWFWRKMQYLILGNLWVKDND